MSGGRWELAKGARTLVEYVCGVSAGETVLIYADTAADASVAETMAEAVMLAGGVPCLFKYETRLEVGQEPPAPLAAAMLNADVMIELAEKYLIHTDAYLAAMKHGVRVLCLTGATADMIRRCVAYVDYPSMLAFGDALVNVLSAGRTLSLRTPAGTSLECQLGDRPVEHNATRLRGPGEESFLGGQVSWYPLEDTIHGKLVFDGAIWPPPDLGLLERPIELEVRAGVIQKINGGREARRLEAWLSSFQDPKMRCLAHFSYGFNPGARLSGKILEDERVFGSVEIGIGSQVPSFAVGQAAAHTDGVMLHPTVILDGVVLEEEGTFVHPELADLSKQLMGG